MRSTVGSSVEAGIDHLGNSEKMYNIMNHKPMSVCELDDVSNLTLLISRIICNAVTRQCVVLKVLRIMQTSSGNKLCHIFHFTYTILGLFQSGLLIPVFEFHTPVQRFCLLTIMLCGYNVRN